METNSGYLELLGPAVGVVVFLFFAAGGNIVEGFVAGFIAYGFANEYIGGDNGNGEDADTWGKEKDTTDSVPTGPTVEGPSGDVLGTVPDGMEEFDERYAVRAMTLRPVTVEVEPAGEKPVELARTVAERLGYEDSPLLNRVAPVLPDRVETEIKRRVRTDLDRKMDAEDGNSPVVGYATVRAADGFDGFTYSVEYSPGTSAWTNGVRKGHAASATSRRFRRPRRTSCS